MKNSNKTLAAGITGGLGLLFALLGQLFDKDGPGWSGLTDPIYSGQLAAAIGALLMGWYARDDNVSSEGKLAPKDKHESTK